MRTNLRRVLGTCVAGLALWAGAGVAPVMAEAPDDPHGNYIQVGALPLSFWSTKYERRPEGAPVRKDETSSSEISAVDPTLGFRGAVGRLVGRAELSQAARTLQLGYQLGHMLEAGLVVEGGQSTIADRRSEHSRSDWLLGPYALLWFEMTEHLGLEAEARLLYVSASDETADKEVTGVANVVEAINTSGYGFFLGAQLVFHISETLAYCPSFGLRYLSLANDYLPVAVPPGAAAPYVGAEDQTDTAIKILPLALRFRF